MKGYVTAGFSIGVVMLGVFLLDLSQAPVAAQWDRIQLVSSECHKGKCLFFMRDTWSGECFAMTDAGGLEVIPRTVCDAPAPTEPPTVGGKP